MEHWPLSGEEQSEVSLASFTYIMELSSFLVLVEYTLEESYYTLILAHFTPLRIS